MGASAEVDLDPDGLRRVANDLAALQPAVRMLTSHVAAGTGAAAHFGEPDAQRSLAVALAATCDDVVTALSRAEQLVSTLADELRAGAATVTAADQRSEQNIRAAGS